LFSEARRRRRRRWLAGGAVGLLLVAITAAVALTGADRMPGGRGGTRSAGAASAGEAAPALAALIVWSDGSSLFTGAIEPSGSVIPRVVVDAYVALLPCRRLPGRHHDAVRQTAEANPRPRPGPQLHRRPGPAAPLALYRTASCPAENSSLVRAALLADM
jgi:hypothetical protein